MDTLQEIRDRLEEIEEADVKAMLRAILDYADFEISHMQKKMDIIKLLNRK